MKSLHVQYAMVLSTLHAKLSFLICPIVLHQDPSAPRHSVRIVMYLDIHQNRQYDLEHMLYRGGNSTLAVKHMNLAADITRAKFLVQGRSHIRPREHLSPMIHMYVEISYISI